MQIATPRGNGVKFKQTQNRFQLLSKTEGSPDFNEERRYNDRQLSLRKKVFCIKHKIPNNNTYEKAFEMLNNKIVRAIEIERKQSYTNSKRVLSIENYPQVYRNGSSKLMQLIKSSRQTNNLEFKNEIDIKRTIRKIDLNRLAEQREKQKSKIVLPKLYDYDDKMKTRMMVRMSTKHINANVSKVVQKPKPMRTHEEFVTQRLLTEAHVDFLRSYSKNSYLASLNYTFRNPLE